jgi:metal-sulfur cluster biosynthetic enzyme
VSPSQAEQIDTAIAKVYDPCSLAASAPMSIIDMGLLRQWNLADGELTVSICVTTPACTMLGHIVRGIEESASTVPGVDRVVVNVVGDFFWTEELMTPGGRADLAERRRLSQEVTGTRPQEWKERHLGQRP